MRSHIKFVPTPLNHIFGINVYQIRTDRKPKKFKYFSKKCVSTKIASNAQSWVEQKRRITLLKSATIKKADEQQNQSTKTTNINYIYNFMSIKKKLTEAQNSVRQKWN